MDTLLFVTYVVLEQVFGTMEDTYDLDHAVWKVGTCNVQYRQIYVL